jgi:predicted nucleotidyltransferase
MSLNRTEIFELLKQFAIAKQLDFVAVYGSFHYGKQTENSDIDILIDSSRTISYDELDEWVCELEHSTGRIIDLITARLMISSLLCGHVWRLKDYTVIHGEPYVMNKEELLS